MVLIGAPGAGKTTVGMLLADRLGVGFRDTDQDIEQSTGRTVAQVFVDDGEPAFRALERDAVRRALEEHAGVLALGGGAVVDDSTRALLAGHPVVWLKVGLAAASQRVGLNRDRPLLLGNVRATLHRLMEARSPLYAEASGMVVDTDGRTAAEVADEVIVMLTQVRGSTT